MIEAHDLEKRYGKVQAVAGLSFSASDGAITTILGGNGSGKTTTLRMIAGLVRPDRGAVRIDGTDVAADRTSALSRLGALHDDLGLYPRLTAREHLVFSARLHGMSSRAGDEAARRAIELVGIEDIAKRPTRGFSHGQRMKVALARALVHRPGNLILDEPTRGLDIFAVRMLRDLLKRLRAEGVCIVMSNHVLAEVMELSDQVVMVADGRLKASGSPADLVARTGARSLEEAFIAVVGEAAANETRRVG
jgi:sodium transport system ATP-binding protein